MDFLYEFRHLKIQLKKINFATNNFSDNNVIGVGGFGKVYKGKISHYKGHGMVAFKRLDRRFGQGDPEFWKEIMMFSSHTHENLISLLGYCDENDEKILVYDLASRGSLDRYLSDVDLTWTLRLKICLAAARGLNYLHDPKGTQQRVIHCDIKSSNILLDDNWNAKLSDMGLSKIAPANQQHTSVLTDVVGTLGYCDPLYMETYLLTKESDVYSFGVVLFEVLCGRLCYEYSNIHQFKAFVPMWKKSYEREKLDEIIFQDLKKQQMAANSLVKFSHIAYQCLQIRREKRPSMARVVKELELALEYHEIAEGVQQPTTEPKMALSKDLGETGTSMEKGFSEDFHVSDIKANLRTQTTEHPRHILRMLVKSLARELDLEKELTESEKDKEDLKLKLQSIKQQALNMEKAAEVIRGRVLEAENDAAILMGISRDFVAQHQLNLDGFNKREDVLRSKLDNCVELLKAKEFSKLGNSISMENLSEIELNLICSSEKLVNLERLAFEVLHGGDADISVEFVEKSVAIDFLVSFLASEVKEVECVTNSIEVELVEAHQRLFSCKHLEESFSIVEDKLHHFEDCLKALQEHVLKVKMVLANQQKKVLAFNYNEDTKEKRILQTTKQHHTLQMLEKSLARELDLEKELTESEKDKEDLKLKLQSAEQEALNMEKAAEVIWGRFLEAENAAAILMGISRDFVAQYQLNLDGFNQREDVLRSELDNCIELLNAKDSSIEKLDTKITQLLVADNLEVSTLREKVARRKDQRIQIQF